MENERKQLQYFMLDAIAEMICGNAPYQCFPYKESSKLTSFFRDDLGLPYFHDGSTRKYWVRSVLNQENKKELNGNQILSVRLIPIIEKLFDLKYFMSAPHETYFTLLEKKPNDEQLALYDSAINMANNVFKHVDLEVIKQTNPIGVKLKQANTLLISTSHERLPSHVRYEFIPVHFDISGEVETDLISVMMPFDEKFNVVYKSIKQACHENGFRCVRADDIWEKSVIMNDIATLIYKSQFVVVDFSGRNPNVMYETGIAHSWGKEVIPMAQHESDIPFDLRHHRTVFYLSNEQGLLDLRNNLKERLGYLKQRIGTE